jgi:hypothetical protein
LFADGCHPHHNTVARRAWIRKGQEKQVKTNTGRKRLNINGLLNVEEMRGTFLLSDTINAESTIELFAKA